MAEKYFLKEIIKKIITKEDFLILLEEIEQIENMVFKNTKIPLSERAKGKISEELRGFIKELEKEKSFLNLPQKQFSFFQQLKKNLKKIPQIKLELAFYPSPEFCFLIKKWFQDNLQINLILDIIINPKIAGGVIIEYQGKYGDFSLAKEINKFFEKTNG